MPKVSQEHLDARRAQILEGARRAFAEHGYEGATVARLEEETGSRAARSSTTSTNKLDLFVALAMEMNTRFGDLLARAGPRRRLRAIADGRNPEWLAVLIETEAGCATTRTSSERIEATPPEHGARIHDWFRDQQADGTLRGRHRLRSSSAASRPS